MKTAKSIESSEVHRENIGRNDPCPCSSGKKYKKCCESKKEELATSTRKLISMKFTTEPIIEDRDYDVVSEEDEEAIKRLYYKLNYHPESIKSEDDEYFHTLIQLRKKYSNYPIIWNHITMGYNILGLYSKVRESIFETYNKFPHYLFAMTGIANIYLAEGNPEKILEIFKNAKSLPEIYPNRSVFHVSEGLAFHHIIAHYYCIKGEVTIAQNQLELLELISEMMKVENHPIVTQIKRKILNIKSKVR